MSYLLPHLHSGWAVDQAILAEEERLVIIRFGHDWDDTCMQVIHCSDFVGSYHHDVNSSKATITASTKWEQVKSFLVIRAISRMSRGRATGPDEIPVEFWKSMDKAGIEWLTGLFNVIFKTAKMPDEWRWSTMVPLYKNKGDIQNCNNYRGIKLLSHTMKIWERVVEMRKNIEEGRDLHMVFIDLEKAYDKVWECPAEAIKDICDGAKTRVRKLEETSNISIDAVHSGDGPWCMLFADDIVLIDESGMRVNSCGWSDRLDEADVEVRLAAQVIPKKERVATSTTMSHISVKRLDEMEACLEYCVIRKFHRNLKTGLVVWAECWRLRTHVHKMHVAEMRMLRWMCGHTRGDKIRNEVIREGGSGLSWWTRPREARRDAPDEEVEVMVVEGWGGRGRPKKYWEEDMTLDRKEWRSRIKVEGSRKLDLSTSEVAARPHLVGFHWVVVVVVVDENDELVLWKLIYRVLFGELGDKIMNWDDQNLVVARSNNNNIPNVIPQVGSKEMDEVLSSVAETIKNFAVIYLVDITEVPDFNTMYELYDPSTIMFFFRNKHIMIDLGTGNNNKINWALKDKQEFVDIVETLYRGARKGQGLVIAPKDYSTKYRY
ncbi:hypothetical protein H5410_020008 [Solanum commersonii]|uniref:Thioredoxin-like protein YLS8 n=2 Tax=Magnoliopsida TaxID=3398 RepID=A0A9J5Z9Z2_SOLCO|nr:hypothetical protein H5410_020008 [Solanum commersonii]